MKRFTDSIRSAIASENWFAALFLTLAIPDVCGALENPHMGIGERYKSWFNRYLQPQYAPETSYQQMMAAAPDLARKLSEEEIQWINMRPVNPRTTFTAKDCYDCRCACLHQGRSKQKGHIHFTNNKEGISGHRSLINGIFQLQIDIFCLDICAAVERWLLDVAENHDVQNRMQELIEIHYLSDLIRIKTDRV